MSVLPATLIWITSTFAALAVAIIVRYRRNSRRRRGNSHELPFLLPSSSAAATSLPNRSVENEGDSLPDLENQRRTFSRASSVSETPPQPSKRRTALLALASIASMVVVDLLLEGATRTIISLDGTEIAMVMSCAEFAGCVLVAWVCGGTFFPTTSETRQILAQRRRRQQEQQERHGQQGGMLQQHHQQHHQHHHHHHHHHHHDDQQHGASDKGKEEAVTASPLHQQQQQQSQQQQQQLQQQDENEEVLEQQRRMLAVSSEFWRPYFWLAVLLFFGTGFANLAVSWVQYPVKVLVKSSKLIPTMALAASVGNSRRFSRREYGAAALICLGTAAFSTRCGRTDVQDGMAHIGVALLVIAICSDVVAVNGQQYLMQKLAVAPMSLMLRQNFVCFLGSVAFMAATSDVEALALKLLDSPLPLYYAVAVGASIAAAVWSNTHLVHDAGSVAQVCVSTLRKAITMLLSYTVFPKPLGRFHMLCMCLVLVGIILSSRLRPKHGHRHHHHHHEHPQQQQQQQPQQHRVRTPTTPSAKATTTIVPCRSLGQMAAAAATNLATSESSLSLANSLDSRPSSPSGSSSSSSSSFATASGGSGALAGGSPVKAVLPPNTESKSATTATAAAATSATSSAAGSIAGAGSGASGSSIVPSATATLASAEAPSAATTAAATTTTTATTASSKKEDDEFSGPIDPEVLAKFRADMALTAAKIRGKRLSGTPSMTLVSRRPPELRSTDPESAAYLLDHYLDGEELC